MSTPLSLSFELLYNFITLNIFLNYKKIYSHLGNLKDKVKSKNKMYKIKKYIKRHVTELEMKKKIIMYIAT